MSASPVEFRGEYGIDAPRASVFAALTDAFQLRLWFAEDVRVEPRLGGAYRFWGRHTPWIDAPELASGRVTAIDPPSLLAYSMPWRGERTDVTMRLRDSERHCTVVIEHVSEGDLGFGEDAKWVLADFWTLAVANLRAFLSTGAPLLQPDYSDRIGDVVLAVEIDAPAREVWKALTDADELNRWVARAAVVDLVKGGAYSYGWTAGENHAPSGPATIRDIAPGRMIEHDWFFAHEPGADGSPEGRTSVRWDIRPIGANRTHVLLRHRRPATDDPRIRGGYQQGWASFLAVLKDHVERPAVPLRKPQVAGP